MFSLCFLFGERVKRKRTGKKECHVYSVASYSHSTGGVWTEKQNDQPIAEYYFLLLLLLEFPRDLYSVILLRI